MKNESKLKDYVIDYYLEKLKYSNEAEIITSMEDLQKHGCISGMIAELVYYDDTEKFYDKYKDDINDLLSNILDGTGTSIQGLFKEQFDDEDPLIINYKNKNLMAWFGFEETSYQIYENIYEKFKNNVNEFAY